MSKAKDRLTSRLQKMTLQERKEWMNKNWKTLNRTFSYGSRKKDYTQYLGAAMQWLSKNPEMYDNFTNRSLAKFIERRSIERRNRRV